MDNKNWVTILWLLFGTVASFAASAAIILTTIVVQTEETEQLVACVEAGMQWVGRACVNG
jgi:hypothetical protein